MCAVLTWPAPRLCALAPRAPRVRGRCKHSLSAHQNGNAGMRENVDRFAA